jgi:hypothetical protein
VKPCTARVPSETLVAWFAHELAEADEGALEEHLFSCDECSAASERIGRLTGALRDVIPPVISHALRDKLAAAGQRILFTPCAPEGTATARFAPDLDLMVHALRGDLSQAERVDVEVLQPDGTVRISIEAVPFDPDAGEVLVACQRHYRMMLPEGEQPTFRVHVTEAGQKRRLADYLVVHIWD